MLLHHCGEDEEEAEAVGKESRASSHPCTKAPSSMALQGLDFSPGLAFQLKLWHALSLPVSCSSSPRSFFLVVSFGHCKFRLCTASVGLLLQATIGASATEFCVFATRLVILFLSLGPLSARFISSTFIFGTMGAQNGSWNGKSSDKRKRTPGSLPRRTKLQPHSVSLISTNIPSLGPMLFPSDLQCSSVYSSLRFSLTIRIVPLLLKDWSSYLCF